MMSIHPPGRVVKPAVRALLIFDYDPRNGMTFAIMMANAIRFISLNHKATSHIPLISLATSSGEES
jgi:hypothetical protein